MLKFRSMAGDAQTDAHHRYVTMLVTEGPSRAGGGLRKLTGDVRVTRVGAVLRKTSIDELPQPLNVLAGQMSLVGPRPAVGYELDVYRPEHFARFSVRPGITGLWQVAGRSRLGLTEMPDSCRVRAQVRRRMTSGSSCARRSPFSGPGRHSIASQRRHGTCRRTAGGTRPTPGGRAMRVIAWPSLAAPMAGRRVRGSHTLCPSVRRTLDEHVISSSRPQTES